MIKDKVNVKSKAVPDIENCRVADIGLPGFAECQMSGPNLCPHALPFGYCFLCKHPRLDEIIANSQKDGQAAATLK